MHQVRNVSKLRPSSLVGPAFLIAGTLALVGAPRPFVEYANAQAGSCGPDNPCPATKTCVSGACLSCGPGPTTTSYGL